MDEKNRQQQGQPSQQDRGDMQDGGPGGGQRDRDKAEGDRSSAGGNESMGGERNRGEDDRQMGGDQMGGDRNGRSTSGDRHSSGISNRGMDGMSEQEDLPPRGSTRQSER